MADDQGDVEMVEMIDAATSARPLDTSGLAELPWIRASLAKAVEDNEAMRREVEMTRTEASEVAEDAAKAKAAKVASQRTQSDLVSETAR